MKPTIIFLFNSSIYAVQPWLTDGRFNVVSVDWSDTDHSGAHTAATTGHIVLNIDLSQGPAVRCVQEAIAGLNMSMPSLVVSFAPRTDLAVSGAAHFKKKLAADPYCQQRAARMAHLASRFDCAWCVENPISVLATLWRKPNMYWHPWEFSHYCPSGDHPEFPEVLPPNDMYNKKTCLWYGGGFRKPIKMYRTALGRVINPGHAQLGGKSARTKYIRSLTPRGFAQALYEANKECVILSHGYTSEQKYVTVPTQYTPEN